MKTLSLAALTLVAGVALADQDKTETREVRIYLLDRAAPDRDYKDAAAVLTIERPATGKGRTFLFPRVAKGTPTPGEERATGMIRCLPGTPYFVELQTGEAAPAAKPEAPAEKGKEGAPLSGAEVLKRVHARGAYFVQKIPTDLLTGTYTATVTMRVGSMTTTSEEFQGPRPENVTLDDVAAKVDQSLAGLKTKAEEQTGFMDLKPAVTQLRRELAQLAPAGFEDGTGAFELDRQWCLSLARNIDEACDRGNTARIVELSQQCGPRLKNMQAMLAGTRKEPEPAPVEVPVK